MSALNIEHLKLILHRRFAVKVIAGFDIISHSPQIKREFLAPRIQEGPRFLLPLLFHEGFTSVGSSLPRLPVRTDHQEEQSESLPPACCGSFPPSLVFNGSTSERRKI